MAGSFLKGALISFTPSGGTLGMAPMPNVIVFQFNPETISHNWTDLGATPSDDPRTNFSPLATPGVPSESLSFTLMLDANQEIEDWQTNEVAAGVALVDGVSGSLAALELLQFPSSSAGTQALVGQVSSAASAAGAGVQSCQDVQVPVSQVPVVVLSWAKELYPVRVTGLAVNKKLFDGLLNPIQVEAQITLTVLTPDELAAVTGPMAKLARAAYKYNHGLREARAAAANVAQAADSILGMLPLPF